MDDGIKIVLSITGLFAGAAALLWLGSQLDRVLPKRVKGAGWIVLLLVPLLILAVALGLESDRWGGFGWVVYPVLALALFAGIYAFVLLTHTDLMPVLIGAIWRRIRPRDPG